MRAWPGGRGGPLAARARRGGSRSDAVEGTSWRSRSARRPGWTTDALAAILVDAGRRGDAAETCSRSTRTTGSRPGAREQRGALRPPGQPTRQLRRRRDNGAGGLVILDTSGDEIEAPRVHRLPGDHMVSGRAWAAVAADSGVFVFRPGVPGPPELELALDARDLDWRGELGQAPVARPGRRRGGRLARGGGHGRAAVRHAARRRRLPAARARDSLAGLGGDARGASRAPAGSPWTTAGLPCGRATSPRIGGGELGTCGDLEDCAFAWAPGGRATYVAGRRALPRPPRGAERAARVRRRPRADLRPAERPRGGGLGGRRSLLGGRSHGRHGDGRAHDRGRAGGFSVVRRALGGRLRVSSTGMAAVSSDRGVVFFDSGGRRAADLHERPRRQLGARRARRRRLDAARGDLRRARSRARW